MPGKNCSPYNRMCNLTCKKACLLLLAFMFALILVSYFLFFNHGAPEDIMAANNQGKGRRHFVEKYSENGDKEVEKELNEEERKAHDYWEDFIIKNKFVSIGEIYDNCAVNDRTIVGKTIMLPDKGWGGVKGVKSRTFLNATVDSEVTGGKFFLEVKYNGNDLFSKNWELCTLDEDYGDERIIYCPINPGEYSFQKDRKIPIYLPKGRYETKGWMTNQDDEIILCGFSDFSL